MYFRTLSSGGASHVRHSCRHRRTHTPHQSTLLRRGLRPHRDPLGREHAHLRLRAVPDRVRIHAHHPDAHLRRLRRRPRSGIAVLRTAVRRPRPTHRASDCTRAERRRHTRSGIRRRDGVVVRRPCRSGNRGGRGQCRRQCRAGGAGTEVRSPTGRPRLDGDRRVGRCTRTTRVRCDRPVSSATSAIAVSDLPRRVHPGTDRVAATSADRGRHTPEAVLPDATCSRRHSRDFLAQLARRRAVVGRGRALPVGGPVVDDQPAEHRQPSTRRRGSCTGDDLLGGRATRRKPHGPARPSPSVWESSLWE